MGPEPRWVSSHANHKMADQPGVWAGRPRGGGANPSPPTPQRPSADIGEVNNAALQQRKAVKQCLDMVVVLMPYLYRHRYLRLLLLDALRG